MLLAVDLDGTIRQPKLIDGKRPKFISAPQEQEIILGADKAIVRADECGWIIVGVTNQSGVAAGHKSFKDCLQEQRVTLQLFPQVDSILFCPDWEGCDCWYVPCNGEPAYCYGREAFPSLGSFRKPGPGMLQLLRFWYESACDQFFYVGDRPEDEEAAGAAGFNFLDAEFWRFQYL